MPRGWCAMNNKGEHTFDFFPDYPDQHNLWFNITRFDDTLTNIDDLQTMCQATDQTYLGNQNDHQNPKKLIEFI